MNTATGWIDVVPQLSTAVVAIMVLGGGLYFMLKYLEKRDEQQSALHNKHMQQIEKLGDAHARQLEERERYSREREKQFSDTLTSQLAKNTEAMAQSANTVITAAKTIDMLTKEMQAGVRSRARQH